MILQQDEAEDNSLLDEFEKFIHILMQQQLNPIILPFANDSFTLIHNQVIQQKKRIANYLKQDDQNQTTTFQKNFKYTIYNAEVQKIGWLLKSYLKIRIKKIQQYAFYLTKNPKIAELALSNSEYIYLKKYAELRYRYYEQKVLKTLPRIYRGFGGIQLYFGKSNQIPLYVNTKQSKIEFEQPQKQEYCFCMIMSNPEELKYNLDVKVSNIPSNKLEVISRGDIIFGSYENIQNKFKSNIKLI